MLFLMASTDSLHFDSFTARIGESYPFMVAWEQARKVDNESLGKILGNQTMLIFWRLFFAASNSTVVHAVVVVS